MQFTIRQFAVAVAGLAIALSYLIPFASHIRAFYLSLLIPVVIAPAFVLTAVVIRVRRGTNPSLVTTILFVILIVSGLTVLDYCTRPVVIRMPRWTLGWFSSFCYLELAAFDALVFRLLIRRSLRKHPANVAGVEQAKPPIHRQRS